MTASYSETPYSPDRLVAGNPHLLIGRKVTMASGQNLSRGALLGVITANSQVTLSLSGSADGSQVPDLILAEDCDASAAATECLVYSRGDFDENAVTYGTGHTADSVRDILRDKGIVLVPSTGA